MDQTAGSTSAVDQSVRASHPPAALELPPRTLNIAVGDFLFKWRDMVFPLIFIPMAAFIRPVLFMGDERADWALDAFGLLVGLSGQLIRAIVIGLAYIKRGGKDKKIFANTLVVQGVFAHCRNPLYVGNFLMIVGLAILHNSPWMYLVVIPIFAWAYWCIVMAEERFLCGKFGPEYQAYCRTVNRFIPSLKGLRTTLGSMEFDWARLVRKEYGTTFTWLTGSLLLIGWEAASNFGYENRQPLITGLLIAWGVVGVSWVVARVLKKTGKLGEG